MVSILACGGRAQAVFDQHVIFEATLPPTDFATAKLYVEIFDANRFSSDTLIGGVEVCRKVFATSGDGWQWAASGGERCQLVASRDL